MKRKKILMIPGWGMDGNIWGEFASELSNYFDISLFDWRGAEVRADYKLKLSEKIASSEFNYIIGFSLGSLASIEASLNHKVKGIILFGATSYFLRDLSSSYLSGWPKSSIEQMKTNISLGKHDTIFKFYNTAFVTGQQFANDAAVDKLMESSMAASVNELLSGLDYLMETDLRKEISKIETPILIFTGKYDIVTPPQSAAFISAQSKKAKIIDIDSHHAPFVSHPSFCAQKVIEFIESNDD